MSPTLRCQSPNAGIAERRGPATAGLRAAGIGRVAPRAIDASGAPNALKGTFRTLNVSKGTFRALTSDDDVDQAARDHDHLAGLAAVDQGCHLLLGQCRGLDLVLRG